MLRQVDDLPPAQEEPLTPLRDEFDRSNLYGPVRKLVKMIDRQEFKRSGKSRMSIRQYHRRDGIESSIARWWRRSVISYGAFLNSSGIEEIEAQFILECEARIQKCLENWSVNPASSAGEYLRSWYLLRPVPFSRVEEKDLHY